MADLKIGDRVRWAWGDGEGEGEIVQIYTSRIEKTVKGAEVVRNASDDEPAVLIEQDDGDQVLKSVTELLDHC